jgi:sortase A
VRLIISQKPARTIFRWTRRLLFTVATISLAYAALAIADVRIFQYVANRRLDARLADRSFADLGLSSVASPDLTVPSLPSNGLLGRIEIPRLGLSVIVMEGTSATTLRRAVGHISGTALPGRAGNVGLSGHRDTHFRPLKDIRNDDLITLTTLAGVFRYRVVSTSVVDPSRVDVLRAGQDEVLTLVTCHPFYFVGAAPDRFVVTAKRISDPS